MAWVTFGLSCLSFMWFSCALKSLGSETLTESSRAISSEDGNIGIILFQLMDKQVNEDNKVRYDEFWGVWWDADTNDDKYLTLEEVRKYLAENLLGPSSHAEDVFGNTNLTNNFAKVLLFKLFDTNNDYFVTSSEFYSSYTKGL